LSEIDPATERLSERERTLILAILATLTAIAPDGWSIVSSLSCPCP